MGETSVMIGTDERYSIVSAAALKPSDFKEGCAISWNDDLGAYSGMIPLSNEQIISSIPFFRTHLLKRFDRSVLLILKCVSKLGIIPYKHKKAIVCLGSSRGATELLEKNFKQFLAGEKLSPYASPTTSLGNIASWVSQLFKNSVEVEQSMTCSTSTVSILNGLAWIKAGFADIAVVGGTESPLTPYTLAQMKSLRIMAPYQPGEGYPCKAGDLSKTVNSMVLGEGAVCFILCKDCVDSKPLAKLRGWGSAINKIQHPADQNAEGSNFFSAMQQATKGEVPDIIITHTPGTIIGDAAEYEAIHQLFPEQPACINFKWRDGHALGASAGLSVYEAIYILNNQKLPQLPSWLKEQKFPKKIQTILINSAGFGGQAVSLFLEKV